MRRRRGKRPSAGTVLAIIAIVLAVTGTSVAGVATISSLDKKEKKQARTIAQQEIAKAAPGLSVAKAIQAQSASVADSVQSGSIGTGQLSGSIPAAHVTRTGPQSIPDNVETALQFDSERYDTAAMHDNATNNSRMTAPVPGIYAVTAQIDWAFDVDPGRELSIRRNGGTAVAFAREGADNVTLQQVTTQIKLQAGDYIEAIVFQESGADLNVLTQGEYSPELSMAWVAPGP